MAKFCMRCGKQVSDEKMICPICGQNIGVPIKKIKKLQEEKKVNENWIKIILAISAVSVIMGVFVIQITNRPPNTNWIKENVPNEILQYTIGEETGVSVVQNVDVKRRDMKEKKSVTDCILKLEDEKIVRTVFFRVTTKKEGLFNWKVDDWKEYQTETVILKKEYGEQCAKKYIENREYELENGKCIDEKETDCFHYVYNVNEETLLLKVKGEITYSARIKHDMETYPQEFYIENNLDVSKVNGTWNLDGTWTGETSDYTIKMNIKSSDEKKYTLTGECYYDEDGCYKGGTKFKYKNPVVVNDKYVKIEDAFLEISFWCDYPWCILRFYPDKATIQTGEYGDENLLMKK